MKKRDGKGKQGKANENKNLEANIPIIEKAGFGANKNPITHWSYRANFCCGGWLPALFALKFCTLVTMDMVVAGARNRRYLHLDFAALSNS